MQRLLLSTIAASLFNQGITVDNVLDTVEAAYNIQVRTGNIVRIGHIQAVKWLASKQDELCVGNVCLKSVTDYEV